MYTLYCSLFHPCLSYCNLIWGNTYPSKVKCLFTLQKKAIRLICNAGRLAPTNNETRTRGIVLLESHKAMHHSISTYDCVAKATVTLDRTISGSYDLLRLGHGATDRQSLLRSPAAVAYRDQPLCVVALPRTIGENQWQQPS